MSVEKELTGDYPHVEVFSDLVLELAVHRCLCEPGGQVLTDVPGDGGVWKGNTEREGNLRDMVCRRGE